MDNIQNKRQCKRGQVQDTSVSLRSLDPLVWFKFWGGSECCVRDISLLGVGLCCDERLPVGTRLSIDLRLGRRESNIRIFGRVAWTEKTRDNYRAGVRFSWWKDDQDKKILDDFVEKLN
ncbi:MAG: PilZ domain-containing protein [PVC group bacterium]|nr:PilZ domain-containing protein [PVC group bacterium]